MFDELTKLEKKPITKERINALLTRVRRHYISPLSKVYTEIEAFEHLLGLRPLTIQVNDPFSWRHLETKAELSGISKEEAFERLSLIADYLENGHYPFSGDSPLELGESFPYFEWINQGEQYTLTQGLGDWQLIVLERKEQMANLSTIFELLEDDNRLFTGRILVVGKMPMGLSSTILAHFDALRDQLYWIEPKYLPAIRGESGFGHSKSFASLFRGGSQILVVDPKGRYHAGLTRLDLQKQLTALFTEEESKE